ncbi:unnamed protein product [Mytilus coruscus]|uniref:Uncharacterized protein n=1 Tax=Mytilus coruscus TaxID=42192 RepID=A0A6J8AFV0_MYTCO|nr:unnamed protein product [Mytilus coruscus]
MGDYKYIEVNIHSPMQATVSLVSPQGETYAVYFDQKSTCSYPFSKLQSTEKLRKVECKHRIFILICLDCSQTCNIIEQYSYTLTEVGDIVNRLDAFALQPNSLKLNIPSTFNYSDLKKRYWHLTSSDPFELTYLHGVISKCYGCDKKYTDINRKSPFDVIIKHLEVRLRFNNDKKEWYISANKEKSNAYYHLQTDCVQKVHPNFKAGDIIITNELRLRRAQALSHQFRN